MGRTDESNDKARAFGARSRRFFEENCDMTTIDTWGFTSAIAHHVCRSCPSLNLNHTQPRTYAEQYACRLLERDSCAAASQAVSFDGYHVGRALNLAKVLRVLAFVDSIPVNVPTLV